MTGFISAHLALLLVLAVAAALLWIALFLFSCLCAAAITRAVDVLEREEECGLGRAFHLGRQRFGAVLRLRLLLLLFGLLVLGVIGVLAGLIVLAVAVHAYVAVAVLGLVAVDVGVILFAAAVAYPTFERLALRTVALEATGAWAGLEATLRLMRRRIGPVVVLWAIQLAIGIGLGIAYLVVIVALFLPAGAILLVGLASGNGAAVIAVAALGVIAVAALVVASAAIAAFQSTYWTLGYRQLQAG